MKIQHLCLALTCIIGFSTSVLAEQPSRSVARFSAFKQQPAANQDVPLADIDPFGDESASTKEQTPIEPSRPRNESSDQSSIFAEPTHRSPAAPRAVALPNCGAAACAGGCAEPTCNATAAACAPTCGCGAAACQECDGCGASGCGGCDCESGGGCNLFGGCKLLGGCELGDAHTVWGHMFDCETWMTVGGWVQGGYTSQSTGLFNTNPDQVNIHQSWVYLERVADGSDGLDWGYRTDIMYGTDADDTQAFGNPPGTWDYLNGWDYGIYGWALPQLYGELAYSDFSVKVGHFYTLVGYEVVTAPDNFFFSHAMTMYNSEPFTHTGAVATYSASENLEVYGGWTLGWDTGFSQFNQGSSWLGGLSYSLGEDASLTYISTYGNFGARGRDAYSHSVVLDLNLTEKLNYVFQSDYLRASAVTTNKVLTGKEDNVGINQYLFYNISDCVALGGRMEWWKGDTITGFEPHDGTLPASGSHSYYEATAGVNVRPHANFVCRPEVRYDWSPALNYEELVFGVDAIITY